MDELEDWDDIPVYPFTVEELETQPNGGDDVFFRRSLARIQERCLAEAPSTFRMPISRVRCSATKETIANKPKQLIKIASRAKKPANFPTRSSSPNF